MHIITGKYKNQKIKTAETIFSPTFVVRNALFNILGEKIFHAATLDIFAGDGVLSIEALSRGARSAVMNNSTRKNFVIAKQNAERICQDEKMLFTTKEEKSMKFSFFNQVDIIFCNSFNQEINITFDIIENIKKQKGSLKKILFCMMANKDEMDIFAENYPDDEVRKFGSYFLKIFYI